MHWDNVYETMELAGGENILRINQLVKVAVYQSSSKEKQVRIDEMKVMHFLLSNNQKSYSFLSNKLSYRDNVIRDDYPVTTTSALELLIRT